MPPEFLPAVDGKEPIFHKQVAFGELFYAPGFMVLVDPAQVSAFKHDLLDSKPGTPAIAGLHAHAVAALERTIPPYRPTCLTLYLNDCCTLNCSYCFSNPHPPGRTTERLSVGAVGAAAELVAQHCRTDGLPLTVVFHGGGEPALELGHASALLEEVEAVAARNALTIFRYIATGGAIPAENARWLATHFDLIGLSCDGPAAIHDLLRPQCDGSASFPLVLRTAALIQETGKPLHIRLTITAATIANQVEIVETLCQQFHPHEIHLEPVYMGGRAGRESCISIEQTEAFVAGFLRSRAAARAAGVNLSTSATRPSEKHGPYCNVFRNVLNLLPGDGATACFRSASTAAAREMGLLIGNFDHASGTYHLLQESILELQQRLDQVPQQCLSCFNRFHCTHTCPEFCPADMTAQFSPVRCRIQSLLASALLEETAAAWKQERAAVDGVRWGKVRM